METYSKFYIHQLLLKNTYFDVNSEITEDDIIKGILSVYKKLGIEKDEEQIELIVKNIFKTDKISSVVYFNNLSLKREIRKLNNAVFDDIKKILQRNYKRKLDDYSFNPWLSTPVYELSTISEDVFDFFSIPYNEDKIRFTVLGTQKLLEGKHEKIPASFTRFIKYVTNTVQQELIKLKISEDNKKRVFEDIQNTEEKTKTNDEVGVTSNVVPTTDLDSLTIDELLSLLNEVSLSIKNMHDQYESLKVQLDELEQRKSVEREKLTLITNAISRK